MSVYAVRRLIQSGFVVVAMSLIVGWVLADRSLGAAAESLPFPISPIKPVAFRGTQIAGSAIAMSCLRLRDALEFR